MTTRCGCACHDYPKIVTHERACCDFSTQWRCSKGDCETPFHNVLQYYVGPTPTPEGDAVVFCGNHRSLGGLRVGDEVPVSFTSKAGGTWVMHNKSNVRVLGGRYKYLLIESDCPACGKVSSTDHGAGEIPEAFIATFLCMTCDYEWGVDVRLDVTKTKAD